MRTLPYVRVCVCVCVGKVRSRADVRHVCMSSFFFFSLNWIGTTSIAVRENIFFLLLGKGPVVSIQSTFSPPLPPFAMPLPLLVTQMKIYCICFMHALTQYKRDTVLRGREGIVG